MTTGLDYAGFKKQIATMAVVAEDDPAFLTILPQAITYAENRIYRDLDFLFTSISNTGFRLREGERTLTIPADTFVVPEQMNLIVPMDVLRQDAGARIPLLEVTREFLDGFCSNPNVSNVPQYFAVIGNPRGDITYMVGPFPDANYQVELVGTIRPESLSEDNDTTYISLYLPDLMVMASMVYVAGYQRNYGATQANDPQQPVSYESQYMTLLRGAMSEEFRKKAEAAAWSTKTNAMIATPSRGQ